jgi:hypothetical protein
MGGGCIVFEGLSDVPEHIAMGIHKYLLDDVVGEQTRRYLQHDSTLNFPIIA